MDVLALDVATGPGLGPAMVCYRIATDATLAARWPVGALAADPGLDRTAKALPAPLADHLPGGTEPARRWAPRTR